MVDGRLECLGNEMFSELSYYSIILCTPDLLVTPDMISNCGCRIRKPTFNIGIELPLMRHYYNSGARETVVSSTHSKLCNHN